MKSKLYSLLPIFVFIILFAGGGIIAGDFYAMPALVAFLVALFVALLQNRKLSFNRKLEIIAKGAGDVNIITMILIFLVAGAFSGIVSAAGGVESTVNFGLSILPAKYMIVGLFLIGCFISISMGTSMGTITALAPIAVGIAKETNFPVAICIGAVVSGAMFGDNLSMISDTTIASVRTQGAEMKDKFKENFFIVLPAAIVAIGLFYFKSTTLMVAQSGSYEYSLLKVIPYLVVLIGALIGFNVFAVLFSGIGLSMIVGMATKSFTADIKFNRKNADVACIVALVKENGGIEFIVNGIKTATKGKRGAEFGIAILAFLVDLCTANNTVAIVLSGPIAKEIGDSFEVEPKRVASILDIFASVGQGLIPYGAQLLTAAALVVEGGFKITPINIIPYLYYPILMGVSAIMFILFRPQTALRQKK